MIKGGKLGGNTITGLKFEADTDLRTAFANAGFSVSPEGRVSIQEDPLGILVPKHSFYDTFLATKGIDWKTIISKKLLPDEAYFSYATNKVIIVEKKFQSVSGSVDEKLQTCDFKKRQYQKLCASIKDIKVEYIYILNDWFRNPTYRDVLDYIEEVGCSYHFEQVPLDVFDIS